MWAQISHRDIGRSLLERRKMMFCPQKCICIRFTNLSPGTAAIKVVHPRGPLQWGCWRDERKHRLSTEPVPVSAYVGSSKNPKDLKDRRGGAGVPPLRPAVRARECERQAVHRPVASPHHRVALLDLGFRVDGLAP